MRWIISGHSAHGIYLQFDNICHLVAYLHHQTEGGINVASVNQGIRVATSKAPTLQNLSALFPMPKIEDDSYLQQFKFQIHSPDYANPRKNPVIYSNEIEAALVEDDLTRVEVNSALALLPDLSRFFTYLEHRGAHKAAWLIRRTIF